MHKDLAERIASEKLLYEKGFEIPSNPRHDGYQRILASIIIRRFDRKSSNVKGIKSETKPNPH